MLIVDEAWQLMKYDDSANFLFSNNQGLFRSASVSAKVSAQRGNVPVKLPLQDRSLTLYPTEYRWLGGDATDREPGQLLFSS